MQQDVTHLLRGMLMGAADVVPGVSGGTVALVVGIYDRLVAALSHFDLQLLAHVRKRQWRAAAGHIDLRFLIALGLGIVGGAMLCAGLVNSLLTSESTRSATLAAFFGMIVASCVVVIRMISAKSAEQWLVAAMLGIGGIVVAYILTSLPPAHAELTPWYVFFSGAIAICAMILPGISGAYILLILGVYEAITGIIERLPKGEAGLEEFGTVCIFAAGCAVGLLLFSKVLRWLLARHEMPTMAVLAGFMIGALHRIWPFQRDLTPELPEWKEKKFESYLPDTFSREVMIALVVGVIAFALVLLLDRVFHVHEREPLEGDAGL
jgi:putative membrane protein